MNLRRVISYGGFRLDAMAEAGKLRVRCEGRMVDVHDAADIDAWLLGEVPPSLLRERAEAPVRYAAAGVEIA